MANDKYFLKRAGWKVTQMKNCKGFPLEEEVTFLIGKTNTGRYRVTWIDKSEVLRFSDNLSIKDGRIEATISVGRKKWVITGGQTTTANGKPGLAGDVELKDRPRKQAGSGTWNAEGNGGGGGVAPPSI